MRLLFFSLLSCVFALLHKNTNSFRTLTSRMTPGEVIAQHPGWKDLWYDKADGQYGRPAAFYQQLQSLNLGEAWEKINAPVLVMHGTADNIMSNADSRTIADIVNRSHPRHASYMEIKGADHLLSVNNKLDESVVPAMLEWLRENTNDR